MDDNFEIEWLECEADFTKNDNQVIVNLQMGSFLIKEDDVNFNGTKVRLKKGAEIQIIEDKNTTLNLINPCKCSNRIIATNREERIPKNGCETKCFGVVMVCYYCVYDEGGVLKGEETNICGVCIGIPF